MSLLKNVVFGIAGVSVALGANAMDAKAATAAVTKALSCEIADGKADSIISAVKVLGGKPGRRQSVYILPQPVVVYGLPVTQLSITPSDGESPDSYIAIFPHGDISRIAAAAHMKPLAGGFVRDTKGGRMSADIRDDTDVWLACVPL